MGELRRNTFYGAITIGLRFAANALLFIIIARALGVDEFGRFAFAASFAGIFLVVVDYGFCLKIIRDVAVNPQGALESAYTMLNGKLILSLVSTLLLVAVVLWGQYPMETARLVYLLWCASLFYSFGLFLNSMFRGLNQFQHEASPTLVLNLVQVSLVLLLLGLGYGAAAVAGAYLAARILYFAHSLQLVQSRIGKVRFALDPAQGMAALRDSLPFGVHTILATLYFQLDTVFLSHFRGNLAVGEYQAAMRIVLAAMIIYDVVTSAFFPLVARDFREDPEAFARRGEAFNRYLFLMGGAIGCGMLLYAEAVIPLCYGEGYRGSVLILQILAAVVFLRFAGGAYATAMTVSDNQKLRAAAVALSVVFNVALNLLLIPRLGGVGAALVSVATHVLLVGLYGFFSFRLAGGAWISRQCLLGLAVLGAGSFSCSLAARLGPAFSIPVFAATLIAAGGVSTDGEEKRALWDMVRRFFLGRRKARPA